MVVGLNGFLPVLLTENGYKNHTNLEDANGIASSDMSLSKPDNFLQQLFGLICGDFCKDSMGDFVAKPTSNSTLLPSLTDLSKHGFSKEVCRGLVAMLDDDRSGKLGYQEFKVLWKSLNKWKLVWVKYDVDKSGTLSGYELKSALASAGYKLDRKTLNVLIHRYGNKRSEVEFDDFLMCAIKTKTMIDVFNQKDVDKANSIKFTMQEWLENTLFT